MRNNRKDLPRGYHFVNLNQEEEDDDLAWEIYADVMTACFVWDDDDLTELQARVEEAEILAGWSKEP